MFLVEFRILQYRNGGRVTWLPKWRPSNYRFWNRLYTNLDNYNYNYWLNTEIPIWKKNSVLFEMIKCLQCYRQAIKEECHLYRTDAKIKCLKITRIKAGQFKSCCTLFRTWAKNNSFLKTTHTSSPSKCQEVERFR